MISIGMWRRTSISPACNRGDGVLWLLFFLFVLCFCYCVQAQVTDPVEVKALEAVKSSLIDPWKNLSTWNSKDPCNDRWRGVHCYNKTLDDNYFHVKELELMTMNLSGTLAPELGQLSHLKILNTMWNKIGGSIPKEIGNLTNLELLLLNGNQLIGSLPDEIGYLPHLERIQVDQNNISGPIPKSFANLNKTQHLHMNNNSISGVIPRELSRLPRLIHFLLDNNNLSGPLPAEFSELPKLLILQLDNNNFSGSEIPASYRNMTQLLKLSLRNCGLNGSIPDFSTIANLSYIDLSMNQLSGPIPSEKLSDNLTTIILSHNHLNGTIPLYFSSLHRLQKLSLDDNLLSGSVPSTLWESIKSSAAPNLTLDFRNNGLTEISGPSSVPANVTLLLDGNPLCSNNSISVQYCGSETRVDNSQDRTNDTNVCPANGCPPFYEYAPATSVSNCYCAVPLIISYRLKSPIFSDFRPFKFSFEEYITSALNLDIEQLNVSYTWQVGPRLKMVLKVFPPNSTQSRLFEWSEIRRIWDKFVEWNIPENEAFGPYEILQFTLLEPYLAEIPQKSSGISKGALAGIIVGTFVGAFLLSGVILLVILKKHSRKYSDIYKRRKSSRIPIRAEGMRGFTYEELAHATNHFSSAVEVGKGGYGKVYKGVLADGSLVAVKRAEEGSLQGNKEFCTEIELLSRLHHRHLVSLIGYCNKRGEQMLVYEFMPNGTLRDHLTASSEQSPCFATRLRIALGSARGILYLHTEADPPIFHRDIKATNILLDSHFTAKVADFGLSRLAPLPDTDGVVPNHVSTVVRGTPGYLDPEYCLTHKLTDKSDVYSLGVVLLELLTGMKPISHGKNIVREVNASYQSGNLISVVDERMGTYPSECIEKFASLALRCCLEEGDDRPTMTEVVRELESIMEMMPAESDTRSTTENSSNNQMMMGDRDSSSSPPRTRKNPYVSVDVSGSNLVSGMFPSISAR